MLIYLCLKAIHVAAVVVWVGGMLISAVTVATFAGRKLGGDPSDRSALLQAVRRWDRNVTSPAMLLVWAFGLTLAYQGAWFREPWLMLKLALVFGLAALHGVLSGSLRRVAQADAGAPSRLLGRAPHAIVAAVVVVAILVVVKPS